MVMTAAHGGYHFDIKIERDTVIRVVHPSSGLCERVLSGRRTIAAT
jgi:hypothetical protein